jgi:hypothetical protein
MTVARMLAHRAKLIDQMVPQALEVWLKHELAVSLAALPSQRALHHVAHQLLRLGYGAGAGAVHGLALGKGPASATKVVGYGEAVWAFCYFFLLPALKIMRPEWRAKPVEIAVNLGAHLLYSGALADRAVRKSVVRSVAAVPFSFDCEDWLNTADAELRPSAEH